MLNVHRYTIIDCLASRVKFTTLLNGLNWRNINLAFDSQECDHYQPFLIMISGSNEESDNCCFKTMELLLSAGLGSHLWKFAELLRLSR